MIERIDVSAKSSRVVQHNGIVYLAGLVPDDHQASIEVQVGEVLGKVDHFLKMAGTDKSRLLTTIIWSRESENIPAINKIWEKWVPAGQAPARSCVRATPANPRFLIEVTVTAAAPR